MYSIEGKKAVETYYQYGKRASSVIRDSGYPNRRTLKSWVEEYEDTGTIIAEKRGRTSPFTREQMEEAVNFYRSHGKNIKFTLESLGYPGRTTLKSWIDLLAPGERMVVAGSDYKKRYPDADRLELATRPMSVRSVASVRTISLAISFSSSSEAPQHDEKGRLDQG